MIKKYFSVLNQVDDTAFSQSQWQFDFRLLNHKLTTLLFLSHSGNLDLRSHLIMQVSMINGKRNLKIRKGSVKNQEFIFLISLQCSTQVIDKKTVVPKRDS